MLKVEIKYIEINCIHFKLIENSVNLLYHRFKTKWFLTEENFTFIKNNVYTSITNVIKQNQNQFSCN